MSESEFTIGARIGILWMQRVFTEVYGTYSAGPFGRLHYPDTREKLAKIDAEIRAGIARVILPPPQ